MGGLGLQEKPQAPGGEQREAAETAPKRASPLGTNPRPSAPHLQSQMLLALPNRIFKSENQCALTESTNVQLREKWGDKEHIT